MSFCEVEGVSFRFFEKSERNVLNNVNLRFERGEVAVILGSSGCGKSTLAAVMCGLYPENGGYLEHGRVSVDGQDLGGMGYRKRCRVIAQMFQNPDLQFCMKNLREELYFCLENILTPPGQMDGRIFELSRYYGLEDLLDRPFSSLSGGEKQKAALCCLLLLDPKILVLDEPFANLDDVSAEAYLELLRKKVRDEKTTVIAIDHQPGRWLDIADRFLVLGEGGRVVRERIPAEQLLNERETLRREGISDPFAREGEQKTGAAGDRGEIIRFSGAAVFHGRPGSRGPRRGRGPGQPPALLIPDLAVGRGEMIALLGPSGSGKTTLFMTLLGQKAYTGSIRFLGQELSGLRGKHLFENIGIVFQNPGNQFVTTSVLQEVMTSLKIWRRLDDDAAEKEADLLLEKYNLRNFRRFSPYMLSQGQQRRLGVLTMLAGGQKILLLDEPTYGQDGRTTSAIMDQMCERLGEGVTILFSTHDRALAAAYADRVWLVDGGTVTEPDLVGRAEKYSAGKNGCAGSASEGRPLP